MFQNQTYKLVSNDCLEVDILRYNKQNFKCFYSKSHGAALNLNKCGAKALSWHFYCRSRNEFPRNMLYFGQRY